VFAAKEPLNKTDHRHPGESGGSNVILISSTKIKMDSGFRRNDGLVQAFPTKQNLLTDDCRQPKRERAPVTRERAARSIGHATPMHGQSLSNAASPS
jgi:hypothetical protein